MMDINVLIVMQIFGWEKQTNVDLKKHWSFIQNVVKKGWVKLEQLRPTPILVEYYLNLDNGWESIIFWENIRVYNSMFAYTSMGAKIDYSINDGFAPYVFKICGQVHHLMGSMLPRHGESPKYAQLYIYDSQNEVSNRMNVVDSLNTSKVESNVIGMHWLSCLTSEVNWVKHIVLLETNKWFPIVASLIFWKV